MASALPTPTKADLSVLGKASEEKNSSYKILYFGLHGRGELPRTLLVYSGAKWEELPVDWPHQKPLVPFQVLPVIYETTQDGTILELAEVQPIERYLADKYGLFGSTRYETHLIDQIYSSVDGESTAHATKVIYNAAEKRVEEANKYFVEVLPKFIEIHEAHLAKNGSNGHYVGKSITLADLKLANFVDRLNLLHPAGANPVPISAEKTPNLWKVVETVNSHPSLAAWKKSARYQELTAGTKAHFKF
ncbi:hypothetical protein FBU30_000508 [Linnemannia zychae]|nr:hypothetical protein FBU30_000508 [Linnemannia zychae]